MTDSVLQQQQGHLPSASVEMEPCSAAAADHQHPLEGIQGEEWGTLFPGELVEQVFRSVQFSRSVMSDSVTP